jgi:hypothetical protein
MKSVQLQSTRLGAGGSTPDGPVVGTNLKTSPTKARMSVGTDEPEAIIDGQNFSLIFDLSVDISEPTETLKNRNM